LCAAEGGMSFARCREKVLNLLPREVVLWILDAARCTERLDPVDQRLQSILLVTGEGYQLGLKPRFPLLKLFEERFWPRKRRPRTTRVLLDTDRCHES